MLYWYPSTTEGRKPKTAYPRRRSKVLYVARQETAGVLSLSHFIFLFVFELRSSFTIIIRSPSANAILVTACCTSYMRDSTLQSPLSCHKLAVQAPGMALYTTAEATETQKKTTAACFLVIFSHRLQLRSFGARVRRACFLRAPSHEHGVTRLSSKAQEEWCYTRARYYTVRHTILPRNDVCMFVV